MSVVAKIQNRMRVFLKLVAGWLGRLPAIRDLIPTEDAQASASRWLIFGFIAVLGLVIALGLGSYLSNRAATVNGQLIGMRQLNERHQLLKIENPSLYDPKVSSYRTSEIRQMILEQLIDETLIRQECEARGIEVSEFEVERQVDQYVQTGNFDAKQTKALAQKPMIRALTDLIEARLLTRSLLASIVDIALIDEADIEAWMEGEGDQVSLADGDPARARTFALVEKRHEAYEQLIERLRSEATIVGGL